jgi:hypothetical protein
MVDTITDRALTKAMAKIVTLEYDIKKLYDELRNDTGNGIVTTFELEICLRSNERELDIWKLIYRLLENEESRITKMV